MKKLKGFTLIELIVVIAIIAILAAITIPFLLQYIDNSRVAKVNTNARHVYGAASYAIADCLSGSSAGVPPNTIYTGGGTNLIAYDTNGGQINMKNYLGGDFKGYFAFMTDPSGSGCSYALWSDSSISASDVAQLSLQDVWNTAGSGLTGCYPLAP